MLGGLGVFLTTFITTFDNIAMFLLHFDTRSLKPKLNNKMRKSITGGL